jgi:protein SDA1
LYAEEFKKIMDYFKIMFSRFMETPTKKVKGIKELFLFLAQVAHVFPSEIAFLPAKLINLIENNYAIIHHEIRLAIVDSLSILRKKDLLESIE